MTLDLIHFPNFRKTFFGAAFQSDTLALLSRIRDEVACRHIMHSYRGRVGDCSKPNASDLTVVTTVPTGWATRYSARNYFAIDPIFQEDAPFFRNDGSQVVHDLREDAAICPLVAELLEDAERHGIGNLFVAVSARGAKNASGGTPGCSLFTFLLDEGEDRAQFLASMRPRLLAAASQIHDALCGCRDRSAAANLLTPREVDCLRWAAGGKTDGEIAEILSIARWTVVTYLQNAKIKLNCSNRTSAVATALSLGIIDMPEVDHLV